MRFILSALIFFSFVLAQAQSQSTFKRTTATVLFSSIGGGVLGLSTLSFYGKPQEHTDNITTGVLLGFIAGISYVAYDTYGTSHAEIAPSKNQEILISLNGLQKEKVTKIDWPLFSLNFNW